MTTTTQVHELDAHDQAALVRSGALSARELVEAAIARIEQTDGDINAVTIRCFEQAIMDASTPISDSAFAGVPILLKDLGPSCAGTETTVGSRFLAGFVPRHDGELVHRMRRAGLVVLGKTNTAEFGVLPTTEPAFRGPTRNPAAPSRSAGGSSGGAAAALAANMVPIAHANDAGGSIRIPASCCGVFGLKPTRGRTPMGPDVGDLMNGLATEFLVTRSVRDSAVLLDLLAGPDVGDPYWAPPPSGSYRDAALNGPARRLRIAVSSDEVDVACAEAVRRAQELCGELGHDCVAAVPPVRAADIAEDFLVVWAAGVSSAITSYAAASGRVPRAELFEECTWYLYERGRAISAAAYLAVITRLQRAARLMARFHLDYDVQLSAVTAGVAPPLGDLVAGTPESILDRALHFAHDAPLANLSGQPAMSVPLHRDEQGVPVGAHFVAAFGDEACLLGLAGELERIGAFRPGRIRAGSPAAPGSCGGAVLGS
jgi:amidase